MMQDARALVVFARLPVAGRVKTRLLGALMPQQCAQLHDACVRDTLAVASRLRRTDRFLFVASRKKAAHQFAARLKIRRKWNIRTQRGHGLGARMANAFAELLELGFEQIVILGTDTPWIPAPRIRQAFRKLKKCEVLIGPCADGGYYLLGVARRVPPVFRGVRWGTSRVLRQTLDALRRKRIQFQLLRLDFDLDRPEDLHRAAKLLSKSPRRAQHLARWIRLHTKLRSIRRPTPSRRRKKRRTARA
jgi:hypothetical protein